MKLRKGQDVLKLKAPTGIIVNVIAFRDGTSFPLNRVDILDIKRMTNMRQTGKMKLTGLPYCYSLSGDCKFLHFFPAANTATEIGIYFYPPMMKM